MNSLGLAVAFTVAAAAQSTSVPLRLPFGPANRLVSPDKSWALFASENAPQLWIENLRTHGRRLVLTATAQTLTLAWSSDSNAFAVNDRAVSDREYAYVYDSRTLTRLDLGKRILASDADAARIASDVSTAPHLYFHATRWLTETDLEVQFHGHTAGTRTADQTIRPGDCFDFRFHIRKDGSALRRPSANVHPIGVAGCEESR